MNDTLSPREVADALGVTVRTVQRWISSGRLTGHRVGGRMRVARASLGQVTEGAMPDPPPAPRISRLLIANRGEIARRIARTARDLGILSIGIRAPDDLIPRDVDDVQPVTSYLDAESILEAARAANADAIHPGYGFVAENPDVARRVAEAGLTWVGPPAAAISAMGDKASARRLAAAHGVPTVPGYDGDAQDHAALEAAAAEIGYPLLIKPSAGGGGKGMRVVHDPAELADGLAAARREATRAFGDDRLVLERFMGGSRHVEIQVLFDAHGAGVHLGERDCSTQRRSQKIVEESPAPGMTDDLRGRMGRAALAVAGAVGYVSAGTVEMLVTDSGEFYFLEMNTRLQVEHPVTEAVTGRDLVADQLRIASGATLGEIGLTDAPPFVGHAVEARVYAEDPEAGFLPATGRIAMLHWPTGVRVDAGIEEGDEVTDRYDPMLAKVIAHGATRSEAMDRLRLALDATTILGLRTNVRFLRWLLDHPTMRSGEMRTDTLGSIELPEPPIPTEAHWGVAARALAPADASDPWSDGWRLNGPTVRRLQHDGVERSVAVELGTAADVPTVAVDGNQVHVDVEGQSMAFALADPPSVETAAAHASGEAGGLATLTAPMPGRVISVRVMPNAAVAAREAIVIIEAMKMEHAVVAPIDGTVARINVEEGQQVQRGDLLAEIAPYHGEHG